MKIHCNFVTPINMFIRSFLSLVILTEAANALIFSPYKDVTINMDWNTNILNILSTSVTGSRQQVLSVLPSSGADTITWAFASGSCVSENWGGIGGSTLAQANIQSWANAGKKYIISTGGAAGSFKCDSDADFQNFINRYYTGSMIGVDFDIEQGMSQEDINSLVVQRVLNAKVKYSNLRFSFTLACFGGDANPMLGELGQKTMNAINSIGLKDYYINLMVMDYGAVNSNNCVVNGNSCDMGQSAVRAAENLHAQYGVPYDHIELTPMIGGNDAVDETFTLDVTTVTNYALQKKLGGLHIWSFDRDTDCAPGYASPTCNSYGHAGTLGFTHKFASNLNLAPTPAFPNPQPVPTPQTLPTVQPPTPQVPSAPGNLCAETGCHGCLWVYAGENTCFPTYPKEACDVYADQGYQWCA